MNVLFEIKPNDSCKLGSVSIAKPLGDREPRARSCTMKTFGGSNYNVAAKGR